MRVLLAITPIALALALPPSSPARAAEFTSGSTGALGDVVIEADTEIPLPDDGVLDYATFTVKTGATVSFTRNARNTPVFLLATGDIVLEDGAFIDVSGEPGRDDGIAGRGGPGGFSGGSHVDIQAVAEGGHGPGGGLPSGDTSGGNGGYALQGGGGLTQWAGRPYGTQLLLPLVGGSGGAGGTGRGGGGGGGAILLSSTTRVFIGAGAVVRARGGSGFGGYQSGSGGAIRVVAPVVEGSGTLDVSSGGSGHGRARVDTRDPSNMHLGENGGRFSVGALMISFLDVEPTIDIIGLGQASIPLDHPGEFMVVLPTGSSPTQDLTLRLAEFIGVVPLTIALVPDTGDPIRYDVELDTRAAVDGVATFDVPIDLPINNATSIRVWTRPPPAAPEE